MRAFIELSHEKLKSLSDRSETAPHADYYTGNNLSDNRRLGKVCHHMALIDDSHLHSTYCCLHPPPRYCFPPLVKVNVNSHPREVLKSLQYNSQNVRKNQAKLLFSFGGPVALRLCDSR